MRPIFALFTLALLAASLFCYEITMTREQLIEKYYSEVDAKVPRSAKLLLGDETINAYIGQSVLGIKTKNGELETLETYPLTRATITIRVDDEAALNIEKKKIGILAALGSGGVKITTSNWLSSFKVEALKKIYGVSGYDKKLTSGEAGTASASNSIMVQRAKIYNCIFCK